MTSGALWLWHHFLFYFFYLCRVESLYRSLGVRHLPHSPAVPRHIAGDFGWWQAAVLTPHVLFACWSSLAELSTKTQTVDLFLDFDVTGVSDVLVFVYLPDSRTLRQMSLPYHAAWWMASQPGLLGSIRFVSGRITKAFTLLASPSRIALNRGSSSLHKNYPSATCLTCWYKALTQFMF